MSELISGKEAKLAWANSEDVQISHKNATLKKEWHDLYGTLMLSVFDSDIYEFRLKPRTIIINGIEVPAPFDPKDGDVVYFIDCETSRGYSSDVVGCGCNPEWIQFGAWRTEDEIKQVVVALKQIFKTN